MKATLFVLLITLPACATQELKPTPFCEMPAAQIVQGQYLMFDYDNAKKLAEMIQGISEGKCKLPG